VAQGGEDDSLDVFDGGVVAAVEEGTGLGAGDEGEDAAWAGTPVDPFIDEVGDAGLAGAGRADQGPGVADDLVGDGDTLHELLGLDEFFSGEDGLDAAELAGGDAAGDFPFFSAGGVSDFDVEKEAVELSFGERIRAFLFEGVLRGEDEEGFGQFEGPAADGDTAFLHGFEHGGLGLGRGAIDFVSEDHVGEDRAFDEDVFSFLGDRVFLKDIGAGDVRGHQIGGELNAMEGEIKGVGDGVDHERLGEAGDTFEQAMAFGEDGDHHLLDDFLLANDGLGELFADGGVNALPGFNKGDVVVGSCGFGGGGHGEFQG